jgi:quercetin dioxygenase-like cupin family protein
MDIQIDTIVLQQFNVFQVFQITPETFLSGTTGIDYIEISPHCVSEIHRHNQSDAILFVIAGCARVELDGQSYELRPGMRVLIPRGVTHGFRTNEDRFQFVSVQVPPILDPVLGRFDREIVG